VFNKAGVDCLKWDNNISTGLFLQYTPYPMTEEIFMAVPLTDSMISPIPLFSIRSLDPERLIAATTTAERSHIF
jgi:hypothetical protein